ncbi:hypothetical protein ElyMa_001730700 [Elysia marginata]|uniref:Uncharacterized protein n=1 Tax=Elysia marginata TaxID=1093978 RepID=A0AAV4K0V5_9GAST|nr:hypothetical protein ElyMa_001730700 [Elysia marginata]
MRRWPRTGRGGHGGAQGGKRRAGKMAKEMHTLSSFATQDATGPAGIGSLVSPSVSAASVNASPSIPVSADASAGNIATGEAEENSRPGNITVTSAYSSTTQAEDEVGKQSAN